MKKYFITIFLMLWGLIIVARPAISAGPPAMAVPPMLSVSEIKITGDEFVVIKNNSGSDINDLSGYWLDGYNSNQPLSGGVTNTTQQLPAVRLAVGQTILLSSNGMATCGAAVTAKLSVSLTDSGGYLQLIQTSLTALGVTKMPVDVLSWSSGADNNIPNVPSSTKDPKGMYYRYASGTGYKWQLADVDTTNPCQLNVATGGSLDSGLALATTGVPSVKGVSGNSGAINLPAADAGLISPQISEVLPNPAPPLSDSDDEFIELYNPNGKDFDLSGFVLQAGTTSVHKYTFPVGTILPAGKFAAFYSADTGLSLSNSEGQVILMDPSGDVLGQTDVYTDAKDGYAWISSDGLWQWTTTVTAGSINVIAAPIVKTASKSTAAKKTAAAKTAKSTKSKTVATPASSSNNLPGGGKPALSLHPGVLAGIGGLVLVYGLYEYRNDLANQFYKFRRHRETRRLAG